jgi:hypothetical protein
MSERPLPNTAWIRDTETREFSGARRAGPKNVPVGAAGLQSH